MKRTNQEVERIVADYKAAYLKANGKACEVTILPRGWCELSAIDPGSPMYYRPTYRIKDLVAFTEVLRKRVEERGKS